ncbi:MAG: phosphotransferase family protein [Bacteroidales bacterium]|nr:phosphotransferase family protein [Bacteroidales bacterium]
MSLRPASLDTAGGEHQLALALDSWRHWAVALAGRPRVLGPAGAGLTNSSWLIASGSDRAVVRLNSPIGERLGVDRHREARVLDALAHTGITPPVWHNDPDKGFLVTAFIPGRVWGPGDLANTAQRRRLGELVDRYQRIETGLPARDYTAYLDNYWHQLQRRDVAVPESLAGRYWHCRGELANWRAACEPALLTHHDLTPANIIDHEGRLYLLDWEYAAPGCGHIDRLAMGETDCPAEVQELAALINDLWLLVRETAES